MQNVRKASSESVLKVCREEYADPTTCSNELRKAKLYWEHSRHEIAVQNLRRLLVCYSVLPAVILLQ